MQNIAVLDTLAPQWTETCGLANGEEILLPCAGPDILDFDPLPLPCNTEAVDQCDTEVGIARFDDIPADAPTGEVCKCARPAIPGLLRRVWPAMAARRSPCGCSISTA